MVQPRLLVFLDITCSTSMLTSSFLINRTVPCAAPPNSVSRTRIRPRLPHVLLVANMCSYPGNSACRARIMRSFLPAANRLRRCHT